MARINSNVASMVAQFNLARSNDNLQVRLERLATGLQINRGGDDPAGLIISERIGTDIAGVNQAIKNGDRATSVIATTEASLTEVNDLLNSIKGLIVEAANTGANSKEERDANQLQIDSAIRSITRISNTATFGGLHLLDGSLDYVTSGVSSTAISKAQIFGASFIGTTQLQVEVDVLTSAQKGALYMHPNQGPIASSTFSSTVTLQVTGSRGVQEFDFTSGSTIADVIAAINSRTSLTGVTAEYVNGNATSGVVFKSELYGTNSFVSVQRVNNDTSSQPDPTLQAINSNAPVPGTFVFGSGTIASTRDIGKDVQALVNGSLANGQGLTISTNSPVLSSQILLNETFATDPTITSTTFDIIGGGSMYQLGPEVNALQQENVGVQSVAASKLGGVLKNGSLQFLSSLQKGGLNDIETSLQRNDFSTASDILDEAIDEITIVRGRLGAFEKNVLDPTKRSLQAAVENLSASRSVIRDADFAAETSALTRAQILQSAGTSVLSLANQQAQTVLQLLG
ncbi:MAG: flagellin [Phycisphaeraceae bacterium]|nr:MAG: flagellin [Phycisphaeraceae bacterium]